MPLKTHAHIGYTSVTPQCKALIDALVSADRIAQDIACGEWESMSDEGIMSVANEAHQAGETWMLEVLGDPSSGDIIIEGPMSTLAMARDRLEEDARPVSRAQAKIEHRIMQAKEGV